MSEIKITSPSEWLSEHNAVHIENRGEFEILTANNYGTLQVGNEDAPITVNIDDPNVTLL